MNCFTDSSDSVEYGQRARPENGAAFFAAASKVLFMYSNHLANQFTGIPRFWRSGVKQAEGKYRLSGAGDRARTGDLDLGKVALYQLSYSRSS